MQNVEVKYELRDVDLCRAIITRLGAAHIATVQQRDTYFRVPDGRLKTRETDGEPTEWIFYHRAARITPRLSHFTIYSEHEARARYGERGLPVLVIVDKARSIYMKDAVRIHLDDVHGLGTFFEIEALVTPRQHVGACHRLITAMLRDLRPVLGEPISSSYSDMLLREQEDPAPPASPFLE